MPEYSYYSQIFGAMLPCELRISETFYGSGELFLFTFFPTFRVRTLHAHRFQRNQSINQFIILLTTSAGLRWVLLTLQHQTHSRNDYETVGILPLMSRKTLGILDGGRGGGVDRSWRRRGIKGVDKGGA